MPEGYTVAYSSCPCCGLIYLGDYVPTALVDACKEAGLLKAGSINPIDPHGPVCQNCLTAAAVGDSAPSGADKPARFYWALADLPVLSIRHPRHRAGRVRGSWRITWAGAYKLCNRIAPFRRSAPALEV